MTTGDGTNDPIDRSARTARPVLAYEGDYLDGDGDRGDPVDEANGTGGRFHAVADPLNDGPAYVIPGDLRRDFVAARVREAGAVERAVRVLLALVLVAFAGVAVVSEFTKPREVHDVEPLLRDAAAGRVVRVDDAPGAMRWRNRDGAVYELSFRLLDLRENVRRQPYVARHPDSVTFGPIDDGTNPIDPWRHVLTGLVVLLLVVSPQPRHLTKWAWFWVFGAAYTLGVAAYLLLGGSFRRGRPGPGPLRIGGGRAFLATVVLSGVIGVGWTWWYDAHHPIDTTGEYVEYQLMRVDQ